MPARDQFLDKVRADKAGSASDETIHRPEAIDPNLTKRAAGFHKKFLVPDRAWICRSVEPLARNWRSAPTLPPSLTCPAGCGTLPPSYAGQKQCQKKDDALGTARVWTSKSNSSRGWSAATRDTWMRCNCWATTTRNAAVTPRDSRWMNVSRACEPGDALVFYNLACSYSLTEQFDRAALALEKALAISAIATSTGSPGTPTCTSSASNPFTATSRTKSAG